MAKKKQEQAQEQEQEAVVKNTASYKVISRFADKNNKSKTYEVGDIIPNDFEEERIADLLERKLIELA